MNDCTCTIPDGGYCDRHAIQKTAHWVELCRTREKYFQAWEEGRGPGHRLAIGEGIVARKALPPSRGPGGELSKILGCGCGRGSKSFIREMDLLGPDGCQEQMESIVDRVCELGCRSRDPISRDAAHRLVALAIDKSRSVLAGSVREPKGSRRGHGGLEQLPGADPAVGHAAEPQSEPHAAPDGDPPPAGPADDFLAGPVERVSFTVSE